MTVRTYQLLVFDWDGTLMDSTARIISSFQSAILESGAPPREDAAIQHIIGLGLNEAVAALYPEQAASLQMRVVEGYRHHYLHINTTPTPLFDGVADTVAALHAQGYRLGVATGKSRRGLDRALAESGLGDYFQVTRTADETRSKPDPLMLQEIVAHFGSPPEQTLMIGDSAYDLGMAQNAGVAGMAVSYGVHSCEQLQIYQPVACLRSLPELFNYL